MKIKMKIKMKYKAFVYLPAIHVETAKIHQPQIINKPARVRKPQFAFPRLILQA